MKLVLTQSPILASKERTKPKADQAVPESNLLQQMKQQSSDCDVFVLYALFENKTLVSNNIHLVHFSIINHFN